MNSAADVLEHRATWGVDNADALAWARTLPSDSAHCICTSPPYFNLRDYGISGQMGLEATPAEYVAGMVALFRELRRVLHPSGTCWVNIGDSYAGGGGFSAAAPSSKTSKSGKYGGLGALKAGGIKPADGIKAKDRLMIPARLAIGLQADGWYLRDEIVWHKPSPMPSSVKDRTTCAHEMIYLLTKSPRYFFDAEAIAEKAMQPRGDAAKTGQNKTVECGDHRGTLGTNQGAATRNKRSVWRVASKPFKGSHFACYPPKLILPCIRAGSSERGVCPACAAPWVRVVKKDRKATRPGNDTKVIEPNGSKQDGVGNRTYTGFNARYKAAQEVGNRDPQRHVTTTETVGWQAGCKCDAGGPIPAVVLDPFTGSGTTIQVAVTEGRRAVGCELNPKYLGLIERRMHAVTPSLLSGVS